MADLVTVVPIVEGHGEQAAVPALFNRLAPSSGRIQVGPPIRVKASSFLKDEAYRARYVALAAAKAAQARGTVFIMLDCDDDAPCLLGPDLLQAVQGLRPDVPMVVSLAHREYETWLLCAVRSLRGLYGLPDDLEPPADPTAIRDAKGWLSDRMAGGYDPVVHQLALTRRFDLGEARANPSFNRLALKVAALFEANR